VAQAARAIDDSELSEMRVLQRSYWDGLQSVLKRVGGPVSGNRKAQPQSWMSYSVGRGGFHIGAVMLRPKKQIRTELYISGDSAKAMLEQLKQGHAEIELEAGFALEWEDLPSRRDCRVSVYLDNVDPEDESDWPRQHEWLAKKLNDFYRVFAKRVAFLDSKPDRATSEQASVQSGLDDPDVGN
jgi:hypothetical protein